ncbi:MAG: hypothetical protein INR62_00640 [Rhodospirillales bacterium]|nr:hypothetical protein [Acetobacter sp.]
MATDQTTDVEQPLGQHEFENYLVLAADISTYNGSEINAYQLVMTKARSEDDAREFATSALESRGGCLPLAGFTATELRRLADEVSACELEPGRSFNVNMAMTDTEVAEMEKDGVA